MKKATIVSMVFMIFVGMGNQLKAQTNTGQQTKPSAKSVSDHITVQKESIVSSAKSSQTSGTVTSTNEKSLPPRPTPESSKSSGSSKNSGTKTSGNAN